MTRLGLLCLLGLSLAHAQPLDLQQVLGTHTPQGDFARALQPRKFIFPKDHGPHPNFKTEWWYFTGNLSTSSGRKFGYQFTLFRNGLYRNKTPSKKNQSPSKWRAKDIYLGHFALSDIQQGRFYAFERIERAALGLAGARTGTTTTPFRVWLQNWTLLPLNQAGPGIFPLQLRAHSEPITIDLTLQPSKPIVLQGDRGLSQKSNQPGNASYYYSITRLASRGHIQIEQKRYLVQGNSWFDREWSTSSLSQQQSGWDWFALQFESGEELMFYRLRLQNGRSDSHSKGIWVDPKGQSDPLELAEIELKALDFWQSPETGIRYPIYWQIVLPSKDISLTLTPLLPNQEWHSTVYYWEGAVRVEGNRAGKPMRGYGYVELTGYEN